MTEQDPWDLVIGRLGRPHGVRGEMRVVAETDFPQRFETLRNVRVELPDGAERHLVVAESSVKGNRIVLKFEGYDTPEAASALAGGFLTIRRSEAWPLPEGHYYEHQIIGLAVVDEQGQRLGEVSAVLRTGANDVYLAGDLLIPATKEVVRRIDLARGELVVRLPAEE